MRLRTLIAATLIAVGCSSGGVPAANVPPAGTIWFGETFDPSTFALTGKTTMASAGAPVVLVANVGRKAKAADLLIRTSYNGAVVNTQAASGSGEGEVWGFSLASMTAGYWLYEITDIGGNVLASATLQVQ
jgi:hypothetical protein